MQLQLALQQGAGRLGGKGLQVNALPLRLRAREHLLPPGVDSGLQVKLCLGIFFLRAGFACWCGLSRKL